jgi:hypothetical protein
VHQENANQQYIVAICNNLCQPNFGVVHQKPIVFVFMILTPKCVSVVHIIGEIERTLVIVRHHFDILDNIKVYNFSV